MCITILFICCGNKRVEMISEQSNNYQSSAPLMLKTFEPIFWIYMMHLNFFVSFKTVKFHLNLNINHNDQNLSINNYFHFANIKLKSNSYKYKGLTYHGRLCDLSGLVVILDVLGCTSSLWGISAHSIGSSVDIRKILFIYR